MEYANTVVRLNSTDPLTVVNDEKLILGVAWSQIKELSIGPVDSY